MNIEEIICRIIFGVFFISKKCNKEIISAKVTFLTNSLDEVEYNE